MNKDLLIGHSRNQISRPGNSFDCVQIHKVQGDSMDLTKKTNKKKFKELKCCDILQTQVDSY